MHQNASRLIARVDGASGGGVVTKIREESNDLPEHHLPKFVSMRHRYVWVWVPKNGGGSVFRSLINNHGSEGVGLDLSFEELWTLNPAIREFRRYAFVRNPWTRAVSCWINKILYPAPRNRTFEDQYTNLKLGMGFDEFAEWLCSPEGADEIANEHWQSQHLLLSEITDLLRFENLRDEIRKLGIEELPHRNSNRKLLARVGLGHIKSYGEFYQSDRTAELIGQRYAEDIRRFGYTYPF